MSKPIHRRGLRPRLAAELPPRRLPGATSRRVRSRATGCRFSQPAGLRRRA